MKRRFINIYTLIIALFLILSLVSCKKDNPDPGGTAVEEVAGEWWVQWDEDPGSYASISTYNTTANIPTEMWFEDHFYETKSKISVNTSALTFSAAAVKNSDPEYDVDITITKGKIIVDGAKGLVSKAVTDSISYEVEYSDDPGTIYKMSGYRRTRFAEDDH